MKRVLFVTCYASPYRVKFFDELAKYCSVTVLFFERVEDQKHRDASWFVSGNGKAEFVQLEKRRFSVRGEDVCTDVIDWLKKPFDHIVICGYSSPTCMLAMAWLRMKRIPFWMEVDGGLIRQDSLPGRMVKRYLVTRPDFYFSSGHHTTEYLVHYGARREAVREYPFSSLWEKDILQEPVSEETRLALREELGIREEKVILTVGQFIHRKGFDVLLKAIPKVKAGTGVYFVGGLPSEEYQTLQKELGLKNVHFVGFQNKEGLQKYYQAADVYVMPTREDIWGLVINEAMANGLPIVSTDRCVAGLDLIRDGENGYLVPVEDAEALADRLNCVLEGDRISMARKSLECIRPYTIENMARVHAEIFG